MLETNHDEDPTGKRWCKASYIAKSYCGRLYDCWVVEEFQRNRRSRPGSEIGGDIRSRTQELHNEGNPETLANMDRYASSLRDEMGEAAFSTAWAAGKAMTREQAIAYALEKVALPTETPLTERANYTTGAQPLVEPLSQREREVLRLVAEGLSNAEIAYKLLLSLGTVKVHTRNIYGKLGVSSRTLAVIQAQQLKLL